MTKYIRIVDKINKALLYILGIFLAIMTIVIVFQVIARFILMIPLPWSEELSRYIMVYMVFFGAAYAMRYEKLIAVEFIPQLLPKKKRKILTISVQIVSIIFFLVILFEGIKISLQVSRQVSPAMQIPMIIPYSAIPLSAVVFIMNALAVIFEKQQEVEEK